MRSSLATHRSAYTMERRRCGTAAESHLQVLRSSPDWREWFNLRLLSGGVTPSCLLHNKVCGFLVCQLDLSTLCVNSWRTNRSSKISCSNAFPCMRTPQPCWLLLLMCAAIRANFWLRAARPKHTESFAARHDAHVWSWHESLLGAETLIMGIDQDPSPCFVAVRHCQGLLEGAGLDIPSWRCLADTSVGARSRGWQHRASRCLEEQHLRRQVWPTLTHATQALVRSKQDPLASAALTALPTSRAARIDPTTTPGMVVQAPLSPTHVVLSHLPMWPLTGHVWPPSSSVFEGGRSWTAEVSLWSGRLLKCAWSQAHVWIWTGSPATTPH